MHSNELDRTTVETDAGPYTIIECWEEDSGGVFDPLTDNDHTGMDLYLFERKSHGWTVIHNDLESAVPTFTIDYDTDGDVTLEPNPDIAGALEYFISKVGGYGEPGQVERHMDKWLALAGHPATFVSGYVHTYQGGTYYFALVVNDGDYTDPAKAAYTTVQEWADWANGEVYYYIVEGPDGEEVESCGGYIGQSGREYMMDTARDVIEYDAARRIKSGALTGAGFTGII